MNIIYYHPLFNAQEWLAGIKQRLPQAEIREWQRGDERPADYALVWRPPHEMLANRRDLKAVFALGAGVDAILDQERKHPGTLPAGVPLLRLEDTGMAQQMQEYALSYVLRYFRRFDEYQALQQRQEWQPLDPHSLDDFTIGILGAGVLGQSVARKLTEFGFSVRCWSRSAKQIDGVQSFAGEAQRAAFLDGVKLVINLLPNTPETVGILNRELFAQLSTGAYLINIARGAHLVEADLLAALEQGQLAAATLDVFAREPLPQDHPFWRHPRVTITPHIAAITLPQQAMDQIAANIRALEAGHAPAGVVDRQRGY
ncbi:MULTISPECIES: glyoxylate/hydroxypyruvate reductase GhrA [Serratia]|jgi:glyoxylate/hydroxypyruvate reductase A|uniref:Glyoxylate/hydroxypyruvate reductase A n=1 Tax=Serratia marcescens TaxID=615 RepID=A0A1L6QTU6_SERMA|nr:MULTISPECIES: glyoxylate/hydroxypyruvate reductase GhrA [Serratia]APS35660.1 bifunctional glyoxylate/hydroxypyruvate reductase A [Serratia marcescens]AQT62967.1 bifunctional glyoxylate/hydroxypyruvate reductase A [Serratia marcescens]ASL87279.1 bifunctional glyoxylate/hydroxypyruvate reductase A [Serratia marcescens]MBH1914031.1 glyoxylate/hydroxypyruvate reductase GhrA [Serratia marcescens]MBH2677482.1 glyoxylate/hydroxypyruvate reductase GhrA [Serratia marcescens]